MQDVYLKNSIPKSKDGFKRLEWTSMLKLISSPLFRDINVQHSTNIFFSLEGLDYINADGLIWLLLIGDFLKRKKNILWLELPTDRRLLNLIKNTEFHTIAKNLFSFTNRIYLDEIRPVLQPSDSVFLKISIETLWKFMKELSTRMTDREFYKRIGINITGQIRFEYLPIFLKTIIETSKNIVQHSEKEENTGRGYCGISPLGRSITRLCIGDVGQGLRSSLVAKGIRINNDFEAIKYALLYRYFQPEKKVGEKGEGLFRVVQFVSQLNGVIRIRSCTASALLDLSKKQLNNQQDDETKDFIKANLRPDRLSVRFPGVQIMIDIKRQPK